jgi:hypothetical protein
MNRAPSAGRAARIVAAIVRPQESGLVALAPVREDSNVVAILVEMTHSTDIGDSMEREGDDRAYSRGTHQGYPLATNIALYALTD